MKARRGGDEEDAMRVKKSDPVRIDPNGIYSRGALKAALAPIGIDVDFFIRRLKPKKVFGRGWLGFHLIEAFKGAPGLEETRPAEKKKKASRKGKNSSGRGRNRGKGGMFSDADLGIETSGP